MSSYVISRPSETNVLVTTAKEHLFLVAGEMSGDLLGSLLAKYLNRKMPQFPLFGVAGPMMCKEGVRTIGVFDKLQVMGIGDVIKGLPNLIKQFKTVERTILEQQPKAVIFIDYPGFNIRLAESLRSKGYQGKLIHYVCPSVWVWGKRRIPRMARSLDLLLTLFPFEPPLFANTSLKTVSVGHPIEEQISIYDYFDGWKKSVGLPEDKPLLAVFPGSRKGEIEKTFPLQLEALKFWLSRYPETVIGISCVNQELKSLLKKMSSDLLDKISFVPSHYTYELMRDARCALAKSGTVTLELAMHNTPSVVMYGMTRGGRFLAKYLFNLDLPHYCIVNIIQNETVFPELIKGGFDPLGVCHTLESLWEEGALREKCIQECKNMQENLQAKEGITSSEQAAIEIEKLLCTSLQLK